MLAVLHQGEGFVAVAKPSGLLVHRNRFNPRADAALQRQPFPAFGLDQGGDRSSVEIQQLQLTMGFLMA